MHTCGLTINFSQHENNWGYGIASQPVTESHNVSLRLCVFSFRLKFLGSVSYRSGKVGQDRVVLWIRFRFKILVLLSFTSISRMRPQHHWPVIIGGGKVQDVTWMSVLGEVPEFRHLQIGYRRIPPRPGFFSVTYYGSFPPPIIFPYLFFSNFHHLFPSPPTRRKIA